MVEGIPKARGRFEQESTTDDVEPAGKKTRRQEDPSPHGAMSNTYGLSSVHEYSPGPRPRSRPRGGQVALQWTIVHDNVALTD